MEKRSDFGVLYGQKTTEDALLIYSSYEDAKASPKIGDFIVLTLRTEGGVKYLARVEAEVYDEDPMFRSQDKTLVAVHYARIAERELSDRDQQKMFSYTYKVRMLGTFEDKGTSISFTTAVRKLPVVSYHARHLLPAEVKHILNMKNQAGVPLGFICVGEDVQKDKGEILFDVARLKSKRTMSFAQSGFGKTNLMKVLVIVDLSLRDSVDASIISTMIVRKLFEDNKRYYTEAKEEEVIPCVIVVEEAQNVLGDEQVKTSANPFVRVAKEGRKCGIGLVAITQRPSAISEEIRSQAENFFTFYMGNSDDIKALVRSNISYDGVISSFIQRETIPGNLYFVTSSHPFVIPVRVVEFDTLVANSLYKQ